MSIYENEKYTWYVWNLVLSTMNENPAVHRESCCRLTFHGAFQHVSSLYSPWGGKEQVLLCTGPLIKNCLLFLYKCISTKLNVYSYWTPTIITCLSIKVMAIASCNGSHACIIVPGRCNATWMPEQRLSWVHSCSVPRITKGIFRMQAFTG